MQLSRLASLALVASACANDPLTDGGTPSDMSVTRPDATALPDLASPLRNAKDHPDETAISFHGGRILHNPELITVVWDGDPLADARGKFADWIVTSPWMANLAEYKVGAATHKGVFKLPQPAPKVLDLTGIGPLLRARWADGTLPSPTVNSLYLIYTTTATLSTMSGSNECGEWAGYHYVVSTGLPSPAPARAAFAIMPPCVTGDAELDEDTNTASHEIAEAATDPEPGSGWLDPAQPLSEVGDLCTDLRTSYDQMQSDGTTTTWAVQRIWSAKTAAAGIADPCLPAPSDASYSWFNAAIDPIDVVVATDSNGRGTGTFEIKPFAFGPVGKIGWSFVIPPGPGISFNPMRGAGIAGSTQTVTVTVSRNAQPGVYPIWLQAHSANGFSNVWWAYLEVQ